MIKRFPIPPGVDRQGTKHSIGPRWYETQNMRFRDEYPESIGGWSKEQNYELEGVGRGIHSWVDFTDNQYICVGTNFKFYILVGANKYDITPIRGTTSSLVDPITTEASSSIVNIRHPAHGASLNDFVRFELVDVVDVDGILSEAFTSVPEGFQILEIVDGENYKIDIGVLPTAGGVTGGGNVDLHYKISSGSSTDRSGSGWGVGKWGGDEIDPTSYSFANGPVTTFAGSPFMNLNVTGSGIIPSDVIGSEDWIYIQGLTGPFNGIDMDYINGRWFKVLFTSSATNFTIETGYAATSAGSGGGGNSGTFLFDDAADGVTGSSRGWGDPSDSEVLTDALRTLTIQNFGEDLMFCNRGGPIYYYDTSANVSSSVPEIDSPAIEIKDPDISGASNPPTIVDSFLISEQHGHCIAFATNDIGASQQNNMLIRWSDRHNPFVWTPTTSNEAGGRVLREGSEILGGIHTKSEIIVFTNTAIYSCRYVGYPETYGFELLTRNVTAFSRGSYVAVDNVVFFMGRDQFYMYDGSVQPLPKNLTSFVFDDLNAGQSDKCFSGVNSKFTEVIWFYPSAESFEPNKWVSFNYSNGTWTHGDYDMSALDSGGGSESKSRTAWHDVNVLDNPIASYIIDYDPDSLPQSNKSGIFRHEYGRSANGMDIDHSIETGQLDITEGEYVMHYSRILPDVEIFDQEESANSPVVTLSIDGKNLPGRSEHSSSQVVLDFSANGTDRLDYTPDFNATAIRGRARTISFRASTNTSGFGWRLGTLRLDLKTDGKRS